VLGEVGGGRGGVHGGGRGGKDVGEDGFQCGRRKEVVVKVYGVGVGGVGVKEKIWCQVGGDGGLGRWPRWRAWLGCCGAVVGVYKEEEKKR